MYLLYLEECTSKNDIDADFGGCPSIKETNDFPIPIICIRSKIYVISHISMQSSQQMVRDPYLLSLHI